ncbi:MAG: cupin domain-containing protein [Anaerolineae bacterium]|jgi:quercetin dioxygenase-like cupin family protein|nr:cupin domain-containing protein [Anaerolineae bacterium]
MTQPDVVTQDQTSQVLMIPGLHRRTMATGERMMVVEIFLERGTLVPAHQHPHEQAGYVVSGKVTFTMAGQSHTLRAGDSYAIPGGVEHAAHAHDDTVLVEVFSPPRDEFRPQK